MKPGTPILAALAFLLLVGGCTDRPQDSAPARPNRAQRLLCLAPNLTETLFALGLGDRVVAVTDNDHHPPQVESLPRVGGMQPDYERILALHPDLVLLDANLQGQEIRARLEGLGLPVLALKTRTLEDLQDNLPLLGRARVPSDRLLKPWQPSRPGCRRWSGPPAACPTLRGSSWRSG